MSGAEDNARKLAKLPDRIAMIVGKTAVEQGDAWDEEKGGLCDDTALMKIRDLLNEIDPTLIDRNKGKRLARR